MNTKEKFLDRLSFIYGDAQAAKILPELEALCDKYRGQFSQDIAGWSEKDVFAITYGDTFIDGERTPLKVLKFFLKEQVPGAITFLHILPFYPFTSDDGFSVVDYREVNPELGTWEDVKALKETSRLVFDAVVNHVSSQSHYMKEQCKGNSKYKDFLLTLDPNVDTSMVTRPRNLPLLHEFKTHEGPKWFWTTFSRDQIDFNFKNPKVLLEILDVLLFYGKQGAEMIRLDAIPFVWKELGTTCSHLPQNHAIVKLIRDVFDAVYPGMILLSETNVPHKENISYFGNKGDEAQIVYNFSLPPLILYSLHTGSAEILTNWARGIERISDRATFLNITATHDGIGVRPTEGILSLEQRQLLVDKALEHGGKVSEKKNSDGSTSPYELNITFYDAVNNPNSEEDETLKINRFLLSQLIPLSFLGIPGIYMHSLMGTQNDYEGMKATGAARSINRRKFNYSQLRKELDAPSSLKAKVLMRYKEALTIRKQQPAFHPNSEQEIINWGPSLFVIKRSCPSQIIIAVHNMTGSPVTLNDEAAKEISTGMNLFSGVSGQAQELGPYQVQWWSF